MHQLFNFNNELRNVKYGIWVDGIFSWLDSETWICDFRDLTETKIFKSEKLKLTVTFQPKVIGANVLQKVIVSNLMEEKRNLKLFFSQTLTAESGSEGITFYAPSISAIVHSYDDTYLLVNGMLNNRGIVQYCTDFQEPCSLEKQKGYIMIKPFSSKVSESVFSLEGQIQAKEDVNAYVWLCKGLDANSVQQNNLLIKFQLFTALESKPTYSKTV